MKIAERNLGGDYRTAPFPTLFGGIIPNTHVIAHHLRLARPTALFASIEHIVSRSPSERAAELFTTRSEQPRACPMAKGRLWSVASRLAMLLVLAARLGAGVRLGPDGMPQVGDGIGDSPLSAKGGGDDGRVSQSADIGEESCKCIGAEDKRSFGWECQAWPAGPASFATTSPPDTEKTAWCYVAARCPSKIAVSEESGDLRALPDSFPHWPHAYFRLGCPTARDTAAHKAMDELALMHELALQARHTHGGGARHARLVHLRQGSHPARIWHQHRGGRHAAAVESARGCPPLWRTCVWEATI